MIIIETRFFRTDNRVWNTNVCDDFPAIAGHANPSQKTASNDWCKAQYKKEKEDSRNDKLSISIRKTTTEVPLINYTENNRWDRNWKDANSKTSATTTTIPILLLARALGRRHNVLHNSVGTKRAVGDKPSFSEGSWGEVWRFSQMNCNNSIPATQACYRQQDK